MGNDIPHYYGDYVRILFVATAMLSFVAMPLWGDLLPFVNTSLQIAAPLLLVLLAGLTSARNVLTMIANATIAAMSALLLEYAAITYSQTGAHGAELFIAREVAVILMLAALYFSVKTVRAMNSGKLGHMNSPLEFMEDLEEEVALPPVETQPRTDVSDYDA